MPRLKDLTITARNPDNAALSYTVKLGCSVTTDGVFSIELQEDMIAAVKDLIEQEFKSFGAAVRTQKGGSVLIVSNLNHGASIIHQFCKTQISAEVITELRIFYRLRLAAPFFKDGDGRIHPNGAGVDSGAWHGNTQKSWASDCTHDVGLGARVVLVREVRPPDGKLSVFSYDHPSPSDAAHPLGEWGLMLNRFTGQPFPHTYGGAKENSLASVPYTETNARFFAEALLGICHLADRLEAFMQPEGLEARLAGAAGIRFLPAPRAGVELQKVVDKKPGDLLG